MLSFTNCLTKLSRHDRTIAKHLLPAGRKKMALGFSPLNTKVEGGEIMSDFEIISVVIMVISLVLKAIKFGRDDNDKKKKK